MKKICLLILLATLCVSQALATTYYVDPDDGDDSWPGTSPVYVVGPEDGPFLTILAALNAASTNDTIYLMEGEFVESRFSADNRDDQYDTDSWDQPRNVQINITKDITLDRYQSTTPEIIGYNSTYSAHGSSVPNGLDDVILIDASGVEIRNIIFDGLYNVITTVKVKTHNVVCMTPDADSAKIMYCHFKNFGNDDWTRNGDEYDFYSIVGGGWAGQSGTPNTLDNVDIMYNTFNDNEEFESRGAHEIYINRANNADIMYNHIINSGVGQPLKLKDGCTNTKIKYNTVHGAPNCFLYDEKTGDDYSSGTEFVGNTFGDSLSVIGDHDTYEKPFRPIAGHISLFEDNSIYEMTTADERYIHGITFSNNGDLYAAHQNGNPDEVFILPNRHAPNPDNGYGKTYSGYHCQGDMCTLSNYVIWCAQNSSGSQYLYLDYIDGDFDGVQGEIVVPSSKITLVSGDVITALTSFDSTHFLTAVRNTQNSYVKIYKSVYDGIDDSTLLTKTFTFADSITAMAYDGTDLVFATYDSGNDESKIYSDSSPSNLNDPDYVMTLDGHIPAMCFARGYLVTARHDGSTRTIFYGSASDPDSSSEGLVNKQIRALAGNSDYLYTLVYDNSGGTDRKKIYFTKDFSSSGGYNDQLYFYSQWYKDF